MNQAVRIRSIRFAAAASALSALVLVGCTSEANVLRLPPFDGESQRTRDGWWAEVPAIEIDRKMAESRLRAQSIVRIDPQEALRLAGRPTQNVQWKTPHLVRGLRVEPPAGAFPVDLCGDVLLVGYTADPGAFERRRVIRAPLIVELDAAPQRLFVTCGEGIANAS